MTAPQSPTVPVEAQFPQLADLFSWDRIALAQHVDGHGEWATVDWLARRVGVGGFGGRFSDVERWVRDQAAAWSNVSAETLATRAVESGWEWDPATRRWDRDGAAHGAHDDEHRGNCFRHKYALSVRCGQCGGWTEQDFSGWPDGQVEPADKRLERGECFNCNFWMQYVRHLDQGHTVRIREGDDIVHYTIAPDQQGRMQGHGGRRFDIIFNNGGRVTTHNLWHQGTIPPRFHTRLPVNARFDQPPRRAAIFRKGTE